MSKIQDILENAAEKQLYKSLIEQLNKDFLRANIDLGFHTEIPTTSLKLVLLEAVSELVESDKMQLQNLLYAVDVSEEKIAVINFVDTLNYTEKVTALLVERIWKKVLFRAKYS